MLPVHYCRKVVCNALCRAELLQTRTEHPTHRAAGRHEKLFQSELAPQSAASIYSRLIHRAPS